MGLVIAAVAGGCFALLHAFFAIHLRADQIVGGTAINFLALGVTGYFFIQVYGDERHAGRPAAHPEREHPAASKHVTFFGDAIGQLNLMIWLSFVLLIVAYVVMFRTPIGLRIRAVGEHPRAAETVGISVYLTATSRSTLSGVLAALGGAYLSVGFVGSFNENMTAGRGFIALAALIFGNWRPFGAFAAALLFGASTALSFRLATYSDSAAVLFQALPYVLTLIAVAGVIGRSDPTRIRWPPLREAVTTAPRSRSLARARSAVAAVPAAIVLSRQTAGARPRRRRLGGPGRRWRCGLVALLFARGARRPDPADARAGRRRGPSAARRGSSASPASASPSPARSRSASTSCSLRLEH